MQSILKNKLIQDYIFVFQKLNKKNLSDCAQFIIICLDESIQQAESLPISGSEKKVLVISIILEIYSFSISKNLPIYLRPFDSIIRFVLIQIIISKLIDFIVDKYNRGTWKKESNYVSKEKL